MEQNNIIRVNLGTSTSGNLHITTNSPSQAVSATNNKAQDFADEAKECVEKIKEMLNKTKGYMELTENLSKQNTNVTIGYIDDVKNEINYQFNYLYSLHQKSSSSKFILTCGTIKYIDNAIVQNDFNINYTDEEYTKFTISLDAVYGFCLSAFMMIKYFGFDIKEYDIKNYVYGKTNLRKLILMYEKLKKEGKI